MDRLPFGPRVASLSESHATDGPLHGSRLAPPTPFRREDRLHPRRLVREFTAQRSAEGDTGLNATWSCAVRVALFANETVITKRK